ncbi:MAG: hypothetical protein NTV34_12515 [Proteobacteria bacterium]|nr:hypothetical protein [Pseudomonadota bacterium]
MTILSLSKSFVSVLVIGFSTIPASSAFAATLRVKSCEGVGNARDTKFRAIATTDSEPYKIGALQGIYKTSLVQCSDTLDPSSALLAYCHGRWDGDGSIVQLEVKRPAADNTLAEAVLTTFKGDTKTLVDLTCEIEKNQ